MDRFKIALGEYAKLTDRQIFELYLHARKSDGSIDHAVPLLPDPHPSSPGAAEPPPTYESELVQLDALADAIRMDAAKRAELRQKLRVKYGRQ